MQRRGFENGGWFSLEQRKRQEELTTLLSYSAAYRQGWARLFSAMRSRRTGDNRHKSIVSVVGNSE